ncbi:catechol 1,2-dioxygenase [Pseudonocardia thermophila]|uniref:Catechol 1,2-dioxygenase n=1 Tax=Pseudonocardia thermophila TaxID=1848 RepID=A0A1M6P5S1_PSETH|nr:dioxygenase [Pseudonocardia thermophila]SHK03339.1 catechol 1,2-dioxygenase [Pseudonocardia thermophila]
MRTVLPELTEQVVAQIRPADDRLRDLLGHAVRHLHAFVRETGLTQDEWAAVIEFLTRTGRMCTPERQEFVLLSDVLGVSMLVDAVTNDGTEATESTVLGPFYTGRQRDLGAGASILLREEPSAPLAVRGRVLDAAGAPVESAIVEVWQAASNQLYDVQDPEQPAGHLRGTFRTGPQGEYAFRTVVPTSYPIPDDGPVGQLLQRIGRHPYRPAHIHFRLSAPGCRTLVTHLFLAGDDYLESDAVYGVKPSLVVRPQPQDQGYVVAYDFRLAKDA